MKAFCESFNFMNIRLKQKFDLKERFDFNLIDLFQRYIVGEFNILGLITWAFS